MKIIAETNEPVELKKNQFYALMVTDDINKEWRPKKEYLDFEKSWIGLERTSDSRIYISKKFHKRRNLLRGQTIVVEVQASDKIYNLDN